MERESCSEKALGGRAREGLASASGPRKFRTTTRNMGRPKVDLNKALQLAGELEDEELARNTRTAGG